MIYYGFIKVIRNCPNCKALLGISKVSRVEELPNKCSNSGGKISTVHRAGADVPCMSPVTEAGSTELLRGVHRQRAGMTLRSWASSIAQSYANNSPHSGTQDTGPPAAPVEQALRHKLLIDEQGEGTWLGNEVASLQDGSFFLSLLPPLRPCSLLSPSTRPLLMGGSS